MSQSGEDKAWDLSGLPSANLDDIFKSLPSNEKQTLLGLSVSGSNNKPSGSSGDPDPDTIVSFGLLVLDHGVVVTTFWQIGKPTQEMVLEDDEEGLEAEASSFWSKVTDVMIIQLGPLNEFKLQERDLILQSVTNLVTFTAGEPLPSLVDEFQELFNNNQETLTRIMILENGKTGTGTAVFDFNCVANCSALENLVILTISDDAKNLRKIPNGIKSLMSTHYSSEKELVWIAKNCQNLEVLMIWVGVDDEQDNRINVNVLKSFLKSPNLRSLILFVDAMDPEILEASLETWQELCDSFGDSQVSGIKAELGTSNSNDILQFCPNKAFDLIFSCSIDRMKFKGI